MFIKVEGGGVWFELWVHVAPRAFLRVVHKLHHHNRGRHNVAADQPHRRVGDACVAAQAVHTRHRARREILVNLFVGPAGVSKVDLKSGVHAWVCEGKRRDRRRHRQTKLVQGLAVQIDGNNARNDRKRGLSHG